jgi:predicted GH43/DUF377 family glycosyl hydrolase
MKKILLIGIALAVFALSFTYVKVHPEESGHSASPPTTASVTLKVPGSEIPPKIVSVVIMVRNQQDVWKDSMITAMLEVDTAQLTVRLPAGSWEMSIRGKERGGIVRYAGLYHIEIGVGEQRTAMVRFNQLAKETEKPEFGLEWGSEPRAWKMSLNNPVIQADAEGPERDNYFYSFPTVLRVNGILWMWYATGYSEYLSGRDSLWTAMAQSIDGERWTKIGGVSLAHPLPEWTPKSFVIRSVIYEDGVFRAWIEGLKEHSLSTGIGYAESGDGVIWKISADPVIAPSSAKPTVVEPTVIKQRGMYFLYYTVLTGRAPLENREIWLMTSTDGHQWLDRGCVIKKRSQIEWESRGMTKPAVFYYDNKYHMYYVAAYLASNGMGVACLGSAYSLNGIRWTHSDVAPLLKPQQTAPWSTTAISGPSVILRGDHLTLWFSAYSADVNRWAIGKAERNLFPSHY